MSYSIGVDIGGTKTAIGIVYESGNVLSDRIIPTNQTIYPSEMIDKMIFIIRELLEEMDFSLLEVKGIGIGAPGPLDVTEGSIVSPPNLQGWNDVQIVKQFKKSF